MLVYHSDTLQIVHGISNPCGRLDSLLYPLYPACLFPIFSCSGKFLAVVRKPNSSNPESLDVDVLSVPTVLELQSLCRIVIRMCTTEQHIHCLPLPTALRNYLLFKPYLE